MDFQKFYTMAAEAQASAQGVENAESIQKTLAQSPQTTAAASDEGDHDGAELSEGESHSEGGNEEESEGADSDNYDSDYSDSDPEKDVDSEKDVDTTWSWKDCAVFFRREEDMTAPEIVERINELQQSSVCKRDVDEIADESDNRDIREGKEDAIKEDAITAKKVKNFLKKLEAKNWVLEKAVVKAIKKAVTQAADSNSTSPTKDLNDASVWVINRDRIGSPALPEELQHPEWLVDCYRLRVEEEYAQGPLLDRFAERIFKQTGDAEHRMVRTVRDLSKQNGTKGGIGCRGLYGAEFHWATDRKGFGEEGIGHRKKAIMADFAHWLRFAVYVEGTGIKGSPDDVCVDDGPGHPGGKKVNKKLTKSHPSDPNRLNVDFSKVLKAAAPLLTKPINATEIDRKWSGKVAYRSDRSFCKTKKELKKKISPSLRMRQFSEMILNATAAQVFRHYTGPGWKRRDEKMLEYAEETVFHGNDRFYQEDLDEKLPETCIAEKDSRGEDRGYLQHIGGWTAWRRLYRELAPVTEEELKEELKDKSVQKSVRDYGIQRLREIRRDGSTRLMMNELMRNMMENRMLEVIEGGKAPDSDSD